MPVLAVKPDGTKLFMAWYDRRSDTNNGLMEVYGRWGSIASNGAVTLETEFRITPVSFPPVFSGTDTNNFIPGRYDPTYPPDDAADEPFVGVNLHWWYPEWPDSTNVIAFGVWKSHVGEYNGVSAGNEGLVFTWTDNRIRRSPISNRFQSDIQLIRLSWPK